MTGQLLSRYMRHAVRKNMLLVRAPHAYRPRVGNGDASLLYVHIPFCETLCPYCSFHRVRFEQDLAREYMLKLRGEAEIYKALGFEFRSIYIGGGTPTVLPSELVAFLTFIRSLWPIREVSVETHPHHLTAENLSILADAGIDRLSVGVQTFNDALLREMSRIEEFGTGDEMHQRILMVKDRFPTVNVDMMFNLPGQTVADVHDDVETIRNLGVEQVTFYPLMEGSKQKTWGSGGVDLRREARYFKQIVSDLGNGYEPVSAWCFSRRKGMTDEYIVAHDAYAGIGSGAFGYSDGVLYGNTFDVAGYIECLSRRELPIVARKEMGKGARLRYDLLMHLFGGSLGLERLKAKHGRFCLPRLWKELLFLLLSGSLTRRDDAIVTTRTGQYYAMLMMKEFFTGVNRLREFLAGPSSPGPHES